MRRKIIIITYLNLLKNLNNLLSDTRKCTVPGMEKSHLQLDMNILKILKEMKAAQSDQIYGKQKTSR